MQRLLLSALALGTAVLAGCATGMARMPGEKPSATYADYAGAPIDEFYAYRLDGWTPVSRNQLVVWNGVNEAYLVKVWDACQGLQFAERVGVSSTTHTVSRLEHVNVDGQRCPIAEIRPIDVKRMRAERAAAAAK